jgi:predicted glutamine amidotransferase
VCRLFALLTEPCPVRATCWLLDAPDSLRAQSRVMPDGTGMGWFDPAGAPVTDRSPQPAYAYPDFVRQARTVTATTFVGHVRYASTGVAAPRNTHPFVRDGRLFAHNGVVKGLEVLQSWLDPAERAALAGDTDSERIFAYVSAAIRAAGDVTAGLVAAVTRIAAELPVYALNLLLAAPGRLWALRYPDTHPLWVLARPAGAASGRGPLEVASPTGELLVRCGDLAEEPATVLASVPMDDDPDWRLLDPGELLVVDAPTSHRSLYPFDKPAHPLTSADLTAAEAVSQSPYTTGR